MKRLMRQLRDWAERLPEDQEKLFQVLVLRLEPGIPTEQFEDGSLFRTVSVYTVLRAFFRFIVPVGSTRSAAWMDTPEPPWPRWSAKDPWNVCYYAGPENNVRQDIRFVESGEKNLLIAEKTCRLFCRRLDYFSRRLSPKDRVTLKVLILQSIDPIKRMTLIESDKILTRSERLLVSKLKTRYRSIQEVKES